MNHYYVCEPLYDPYYKPLMVHNTINSKLVLPNWGLIRKSPMVNCYYVFQALLYFEPLLKDPLNKGHSTFTFKTLDKFVGSYRTKAILFKEDNLYV